ncbi:cytochrome c oxidase subunit II [Paenibacillus yanchengensis]|uniref:Cytochrome c oxidase subunit 2 n=1 Tax=Paenibacillus yanchengensis TaxID=2035833 RepID=A0ABW4YJ16_9BACL
MMKRWQFVKRLAPLMLVMTLVLAACGREDLSALNPQGPVAQQQYDLMKLSILIMGIVIAVVFLLTLFVIIRFRRRPGDNTIPKQIEGNHKLEIVWTVIPVIMLVILAVPTLQSVFALGKDYRNDPEALQVKVIAHQFWWEFEYPDLGITTAQELVIPAGKKVMVELISNDVIHSFWIPALAGKIDTNPGGIKNIMYFSAPEGVFLGKCAEFCGPSHSLMDFKVKSVSESSFDRWTVAMKEPTALPTDPDIASALESQCLTCHAVGPENSPYPSLKGIGSRESVGGVLVNTEDPKYGHEGTTYDNLYNWIKNNETIKPDNHMAGAYELSEEEMKGIAEYLTNLTLDFED